VIRAILTGPGVIVTLPYLFFRYHTLRYRFDEEGIHMKVGLLFRSEVNITYARIQDIHLKSGLLQRWLGLANVEIQTAAGSSNAEVVIEGFKEFEAIRDFLYTRMRGYQAKKSPSVAAPSTDNEVVSLLLAIRDELQRTREALEARNRNV
jgi:putative membrane protein